MAGEESWDRLSVNGVLHGCYEIRRTFDPSCQLKLWVCEVHSKKVIETYCKGSSCIVPVLLVAKAEDVKTCSSLNKGRQKAGVQVQPSGNKNFKQMIYFIFSQLSKKSNLSHQLVLLKYPFPCLSPVLGVCVAI